MVPPPGERVTSAAFDIGRQDAAVLLAIAYDCIAFEVRNNNETTISSIAPDSQLRIHGNHDRGDCPVY